MNLERSNHKTVSWWGVSQPDMSVDSIRRNLYIRCGRIKSFFCLRIFITMGHSPGGKWTVLGLRCTAEILKANPAWRILFIVYSKTRIFKRKFCCYLLLKIVWLENVVAKNPWILTVHLRIKQILRYVPPGATVSTRTKPAHHPPGGSWSFWRRNCLLE